MFFLPLCLYAQEWEPEVNIVPTAAVIGDICAFDNSVHVVWIDNRESNTQAYYKRSLNNGTDWIPDMNLTNNPTDASVPRIAVWDQNVHVVWHDHRHSASPNGELFYRRSTSGGEWFGTTTALVSPPDVIYWLDLAVFDNTVHLVYCLDTDLGIVYLRSEDNGETWPHEVILATSGTYRSSPKIAAFEDRVIVSWVQSPSSSDDIFYRKSTNNGQDWETETQVTTSGLVLSHDMCLTGETIHFVWPDQRTGPDYKIFHRKSENFGEDWPPEEPVELAEKSSSYPSIAEYDGVLHVTWGIIYANEAYDTHLMYSRSMDHGENWEPGQLLASIPIYTTVIDLTIAAFNNYVYAIWSDHSNLYFRRCNLETRVKASNSNPQEFRLLANYPNPFNPSTKITYTLPVQADVRLTVFNAAGQPVATLFSGIQNAGIHTAQFNGSQLLSGVYICKFEADNITATQKMLLMK